MLKYIIPISEKYVKKENVIKVLEAYLLKEGTPQDIVDHIEINSVNWFYLPMWRFMGDLSTDWSCTQIVNTQQLTDRPNIDSFGNIRVERKFETCEHYIPNSGYGHTNFDILVPATENWEIEEDLPYSVMDFDEESCSKEMILEDITQLNPPSASLREYTLEANSQSVLIDLKCELEHKAEKCSFNNLKYLNGKFTFTYNIYNESLYYIPFISVTYSYKTAIYDWGFAINPSIKHPYVIPKADDNLSEIVALDDIAGIEKEIKKLKYVYNLNAVISCFFPYLLIGHFVFTGLTEQLVERIESRLERQKSMIDLRTKWVQRENLIKRGADSNIIAEIDSEIKRFYKTIVR